MSLSVTWFTKSILCIIIIIYNTLTDDIYMLHLITRSQQSMIVKSYFKTRQSNRKSHLLELACFSRFNTSSMYKSIQQHESIIWLCQQAKTDLKCYRNHLAERCMIELQDTCTHTAHLTYISFKYENYSHPFTQKLIKLHIIMFKIKWIQKLQTMQTQSTSNKKNHSDSYFISTQQFWLAQYLKKTKSMYNNNSMNNLTKHCQTESMIVYHKELAWVWRHFVRSTTDTYSSWLLTQVRDDTSTDNNLFQWTKWNCWSRPTNFHFD